MLKSTRQRLQGGVQQPNTSGAPEAEFDLDIVEIEGGVSNLSEAREWAVKLGEHVCKLQNRLFSRIKKNGKLLTERWEEACDFSSSETNETVIARQKLSAQFQAQLLNTKRGIFDILKAERRILNQFLLGVGVPLQDINPLLKRHVTEDTVPTWIAQAKQTFSSQESPVAAEVVEPDTRQTDMEGGQAKEAVEIGVQTNRANSTSDADCQTAPSGFHTSFKQTQTETGHQASIPTCSTACQTDILLKVTDTKPKANNASALPLHVTDASHATDACSGEDVTPLLLRNDSDVKKAELAGSPSLKSINVLDGKENIFGSGEAAQQLQTLKWEESVFQKVRRCRVRHLATQHDEAERNKIQEDIAKIDSELSRIVLAKMRLNSAIPIHAKKSWPHAVEDTTSIIIHHADIQARHQDERIIPMNNKDMAFQDLSTMPAAEVKQASTATPFQKLVQKIKQSSLQKKQLPFDAHSLMPHDLLPLVRPSPAAQVSPVKDVVFDQNLVFDGDDALNLSNVSAIPMASPSPIVARAKQFSDGMPFDDHHYFVEPKSPLRILAEEHDSQIHDVSESSQTEGDGNQVIARELFSKDNQVVQEQHSNAERKATNSNRSRSLSPASTSAGSTSSLSEEAKASLLRRAFSIGKKMAAVAEKARVKEEQGEGHIDLKLWLRKHADNLSADASLDASQSLDEPSVERVVEDKAVSDQLHCEKNKGPQPRVDQVLKQPPVHSAANSARQFTTYVAPISIVQNCFVDAETVLPISDDRTTQYNLYEEPAVQTAAEKAADTGDAGYEADRSYIALPAELNDGTSASEPRRRFHKLKRSSSRARSKLNEAIVNRLMRPTVASANRATTISDSSFSGPGNVSKTRLRRRKRPAQRKRASGDDTSDRGGGVQDRDCSHSSESTEDEDRAAFIASIVKESMARSHSRGRGHSESEKGDWTRTVDRTASQSTTEYEGKMCDSAESSFDSPPPPSKHARAWDRESKVGDAVNYGMSSGFAEGKTSDSDDETKVADVESSVTDSSDDSSWKVIPQAALNDSETANVSLATETQEIVDQSAGTETDFESFDAEQAPFDLLRERSNLFSTVSTCHYVARPQLSAASEGDENDVTEQDTSRMSTTTDAELPSAPIVFAEGPSTSTSDSTDYQDEPSTASAAPRPVSKLPNPISPPKMASLDNPVTCTPDDKGADTSTTGTLPAEIMQANSSDAMQQRKKERDLMWKRIHAMKANTEVEPSSTPDVKSSSPIPTSVPTTSEQAVSTDATRDAASSLESKPSSRRIEDVKSKLERAHKRRQTLDKLRAIKRRLDSWKGRIPTTSGFLSSSSPLGYRQISPYVKNGRYHGSSLGSKALTAVREASVPSPQAVAWLDSAEQYLEQLQQAELQKQQQLQIEDMGQDGKKLDRRAVAASMLLSTKNVDEARKLLGHIARLRDGSANGKLQSPEQHVMPKEGRSLGHSKRSGNAKVSTPVKEQFVGEQQRTPSKANVTPNRSVVDVDDKVVSPFTDSTSPQVWNSKMNARRPQHGVVAPIASHSPQTGPSATRNPTVTPQRTKITGRKIGRTPVTGNIEVLLRQFDLSQDVVDEGQSL